MKRLPPQEMGAHFRFWPDGFRGGKGPSEWCGGEGEEEGEGDDRKSWSAEEGGAVRTGKK